MNQRQEAGWSHQQFSILIFGLLGFVMLLSLVCEVCSVVAIQAATHQRVVGWASFLIFFLCFACVAVSLYFGVEKAEKKFGVEAGERFITAICNLGWCAWFILAASIIVLPAIAFLRKH